MEKYTKDKTEDKAEDKKSIPSASAIDIDGWFQKWFHGQPNFSDNNIIWDRMQAAKNDLKKIISGGQRDASI